jgi:hypothetical protein
MERLDQSCHEQGTIQWYPWSTRKSNGITGLKVGNELTPARFPEIAPGYGRGESAWAPESIGEMGVRLIVGFFPQTSDQIFPYSE